MPCGFWPVKGAQSKFCESLQSLRVWFCSVTVGQCHGTSISKHSCQPLLHCREGQSGQHIHSQLTRAVWEASLYLMKTVGDREIHPGLSGYGASHACLIRGLSKKAFLLLFWSPFWVPLLFDLTLWSQSSIYRGRSCGRRVWHIIFAEMSFLTTNYCTE